VEEPGWARFKADFLEECCALLGNFAHKKQGRHPPYLVTTSAECYSAGSEIHAEKLYPSKETEWFFNFEGDFNRHNRCEL
jgi:hypothetical protein